MPNIYRVTNQSLILVTAIGFVIGYRRVLVRCFWPWDREFWRFPIRITILWPRRQPLKSSLPPVS